MVAIRYSYALEEGNLAISIEPTEIAPGGPMESKTTPESLIIKMSFECGSTGRYFDATFAHAELTTICPILALPDELYDVLGEKPRVSMDLESISITTHFISRGKTKIYPIDLRLTRREYPKEERDIVELRAENSVLRKKVATHEDRIALLERKSNECISYLAILASLSYHECATYPQNIPTTQEMSDELLGKMMIPLCDFNDAIIGSSVFALDYSKIMRVVDRGFDPNKIVDDDTDKKPLIFKVVEDHYQAGCSIPDRVKYFTKSIAFVKYLLSKGYNPNTVYNKKTVIQTIDTSGVIPVRAGINGFSTECIEYIEYCETLTKIFRNAGAA